VARTRWLHLLRPRWLAWHAFAGCAAAGMLWLGDWQLHRAVAGNELSWAYTFEWPIFAILGVAFWVRSLRDELRESGAPAPAAPEPGAPESGAPEPGEPAPDDAAAYAARLTAEVSRHGRWHGLR
jgi:hypothetical protein